MDEGGWPFRTYRGVEQGREGTPRLAQRLLCPSGGAGTALVAAVPQILKAWRSSTPKLGGSSATSCAPTHCVAR